MMPPARTERSRIAAAGTVVSVVVVICMGAALARVASLKTQPPARLATVAGAVNSEATQISRRGQLLDRRGRILALTTLGWRLFVDPSLIEDPASMAATLAECIGIAPAHIERLLRRRPGSRYEVVSPLLEEWQVERIRAAALPGVALEQIPVRHYPHGQVAAAILGLVGSEHTGLSGIEYALDEDLAGDNGRMVWLRDARRRTLWIRPDDHIRRADGQSRRLSIDLAIQQLATSRLREEIERRNAGGGRIVVADPRTGEILAMADIINDRDGWDEAAEDSVRSIDPRLGRNRCLSDPYEPGSTFKPFIWSVATEHGLAELDEVLPTPGSLPHRTTFGRTIRDAHYYGPSTWRRVLVKSMNSGMAIVAERMSHTQMQNALRRFGFGERTACGLGGETGGIVTDDDAWTSYTQTSVSMGHEIAVTPLQMVRAFSAFARDGTLPALRLTAARSGDVNVLRRAVDIDTATLTRSVLGDVMTEGTGRRAESDRYVLFGKSGTAQLPRRDGKGYHEDRYISSFIAGAPIESPAIVVLCVIDDPDKSRGHYGGEIAGPVVRDVIEQTLSYLGVQPTVATR